jgi:hypothetical protein
VHRIEIDRQEVGVGVIVAAREPRRDQIGLAVAEAGRDIERLVIVEEAHFRAFAGGSTLDGVALREGRGGLGLPPHFVDEPPVDARGTGRACRTDLGQHRRRLLARGGLGDATGEGKRHECPGDDVLRDRAGHIRPRG